MGKIVWRGRNRLDGCLFWGVTTSAKVEWKDGSRCLYIPSKQMIGIEYDLIYTVKCQFATYKRVRYKYTIVDVRKMLAAACNDKSFV